MKDTCRLHISREDNRTLTDHLYPGDGDEPGAVLLAGVSVANGRQVFHIREVYLAAEGSDYVEGKIGYRALSPTFIHVIRSSRTYYDVTANGQRFLMKEANSPKGPVPLTLVTNWDAALKKR